MYTRKRQVPRHRGDQIIGGVAAKGLFGAGKALLGQLTDGQKGVNMGEVLKGGAAGAASAIPGVGGIAAKAINNIGGGAQAAPATPGQAPAAPGQAPGAAPGLLQGGIGQGVMGLAQNALGMEHGGSIPYDPELAGAPYSMRGVKLMKSGGINYYEEGGESDPPKADFLLRGDVDDMNELQRSRSDRGSAFGTASTDVFMNTGNIPSMPEGSMMREMEDMEAPEDMQKIESRGPRLLRKDMDQRLMVGDQAPQQDQEFDMEFVFDQTPLPKGERDVRYQRYQKTMGVKDPKTGKYYFLDSARGFKGPKGPRNLSISSLPEDQRARAMKAIEDQEMKFAGDSDFYRRQRGL